MADRKETRASAPCRLAVRQLRRDAAELLTISREPGKQTAEAPSARAAAAGQPLAMTVVGCSFEVAVDIHDHVDRTRPEP